jgi:hypothetical protein
MDAKEAMMRKFWFMMVVAMLGLGLSCARPKAEKPDEAKKPKVESAPVKVDEYAVPAKLSEALPGLINDKIRIYKDISPTVNLVANLKDYKLQDATDRAAQAFLALDDQPEFKNGIDFWIIQVQPEAGKESLVWGAKPAEVAQYKTDQDLKKFFANSEYVMVNDQILPKGEDRQKLIP